MKSVINKIPTKDMYPCLKKFKNEDTGHSFVVLFNSRATGMVIQSNNPNRNVGCYLSMWEESDFEIFYEEIITLSN